MCFMNLESMAVIKVPCDKPDDQMIHVEGGISNLLQKCLIMTWRLVEDREMMFLALGIVNLNWGFLALPNKVIITVCSVLSWASMM